MINQIKANQSVDLQKFLCNFCDVIDEAGLATHHRVKGTNYKQFRIAQSKTTPHIVQIVYVALEGVVFTLTLNMFDLKSDPAGYLELSLQKCSEAREKMKGGDYDVEYDGARKGIIH